MPDTSGTEIWANYFKINNWSMYVLQLIKNYRVHIMGDLQLVRYVWWRYAICYDCWGPLVCSVLCTAENCNPHIMGLATDGMGTGVFCFSTCARL